MLSTQKFFPNLPDKTLALTFDDGPGEKSVEIAEYLSSKKIRATFFVVGKHVRIHREDVRKIKLLGHLIGNHTENHLNLPSLVTDGDKLIHEVLDTHQLIEEFVGNGPYLLRAPGGDWSADVARILNGNAVLHGYTGHVHWDIELGDYEIGSHRNLKRENPIYTFENCRDGYLERLKREPRKGTLLFHDSSADTGDLGVELRQKNRTFDLIKELIPQLEEFKFVALDEAV
jgi:peptidoglycan/xylan/chitin deacetylase (PgdA/CDA1 family)